MGYFDMVQEEMVNRHVKAHLKRLDETEARSKLAITRLDRQNDINMMKHEQIEGLLKRIEELENKTAMGSVVLPSIHYSYWNDGHKITSNTFGQTIYSSVGNLLLTAPPNKSFFVTRVYGDKLQPVFNFMECE